MAHSDVRRARWQTNKKELTMSHKDMLGVPLREVRGPINTLLERLSGKDGPLWSRRLNQFNRGANPFGCLLFTGTISIPARRKEFNPDELFQTKDGLYVGASFREFILSAASKVTSTPKATFTAFDLQEPMTDDEIKMELRDGHVFEDASLFCAYFAEMFNRQKNGKEGNLLVNGYANIAYVRGVNKEVFTVHACRLVINHRWSVYAFQLDDASWRAGHRVLSSNCLFAEASAQVG